MLRGEPDWRLLPADIPGRCTLLHRCLQKDARERLHDISDARIEMQDAQAETLGSDDASSSGCRSPPPQTARLGRRCGCRRHRRLVASVAYFRRAPAEVPPVRFTIGPPEKGLSVFLQTSSRSLPTGAGWCSLPPIRPANHNYGFVLSIPSLRSRCREQMEPPSLSGPLMVAFWRFMPTAA